MEINSPANTKSNSPANTNSRSLADALSITASNLPVDNHFSSQLRDMTPKVYFDVISMRDVISTMPAADLKKFTALVENDPSLIEARTSAINVDRSLVDISAKLAAQVAENIGASLSKEARPALNTVVDFYFGYLRPFPDITETEPLSSLLGYLRDNPNWDVRMAKNEAGAVVGACSGQLVNVAYSGGDFKIGWNEHTWVDEATRRSGVGQTLAGLFRDHTASLGSIGVVIETDNPFLITKDPRAFTHADPIARGHFWTSPTDGLGQSLDPFQRFKFWGGQGFGVICAGDTPTPIPYTQVSMVLGEVGSCETINLAFLPTSEKYANSMPKGMYVAALVALQNTIDENSSMYPEMVRTIKQIQDTPGEMLSFVKLTDPNINEVLERGRASKAGAAEKDLAYCDQRLSGNISEAEREIVLQSREYLVKSLNTKELLDAPLEKFQEAVPTPKPDILEISQSTRDHSTEAMRERKKNEGTPLNRPFDEALLRFDEAHQILRRSPFDTEALIKVNGLFEVGKESLTNEVERLVARKDYKEITRRILESSTHPEGFKIALNILLVVRSNQEAYAAVGKAFTQFEGLLRSTIDVVSSQKGEGASDFNKNRYRNDVQKLSSAMFMFHETHQDKNLREMLRSVPDTIALDVAESAYNRPEIRAKFSSEFGRFADLALAKPRNGDRYLGRADSQDELYIDYFNNVGQSASVELLQKLFDTVMNIDSPKWSNQGYQLVSPVFQEARMQMTDKQLEMCAVQAMHLKDRKSARYFITMVTDSMLKIRLAKQFNGITGPIISFLRGRGSDYTWQ